MYEDKTLVCKECGNEFIFSAGEQEFYAEKGFVNEPQRCKACRSARKMPAEQIVYCILPYVLHVVEKQKFVLNQKKADLFTAANVSQK